MTNEEFLNMNFPELMDLIDVTRGDTHESYAKRKQVWRMLEEECVLVLVSELLGEPFRLYVQPTPTGLNIRPDGYGDATSEEGEGWPIFIDTGGEREDPGVYVWEDINEQEPIAGISLFLAREDNRK